MKKLMSIEDKARRLKQLEKIDFPSDQEIEEMLQLKEDLTLQTDLTQHDPEVVQMVQDYIKTKSEQAIQKKSSLLRKILRVEPKKPITYTDIEQLKNEAVVEELKARIRIAKAKAPKKNIIEKVLGKSSYNPFDVSHSKKRNNPWSF